MSAKDRVCDAVITDNAVTLQARDYKGLNNYGFNAVLEYQSSR